MLVASSFTLKIQAELGINWQQLAGQVQKTAGENWLLDQCALTCVV